MHGYLSLPPFNWYRNMHHRCMSLTTDNASSYHAIGDQAMDVQNVRNIIEFLIANQMPVYNTISEGTSCKPLRDWLQRKCTVFRKL